MICLQNLNFTTSIQATLADIKLVPSNSASTIVVLTYYLSSNYMFEVNMKYMFGPIFLFGNKAYIIKQKLNNLIFESLYLKQVILVTLNISHDRQIF